MYWKAFFGVNSTTPVSILDALLDEFGFCDEDEDFVLNACKEAGNMSFHDYAKAKAKFTEAKNE